MTGVVETCRYMLLGGGTVRVQDLASGVAGTVVILLSGIMMFSRTERTFIDTV